MMGNTWRGLGVDSKYGFSLSPFMVRIFPEVGLVIVKAPSVKILEIVNGPSHRDFSFPGKSLNREL